MTLDLLDTGSHPRGGATDRHAERRHLHAGGRATSARNRHDGGPVAPPRRLLAADELPARRAPAAPRWRPAEGSPEPSRERHQRPHGDEHARRARPRAAGRTIREIALGGLLLAALAALIGLLPRFRRADDPSERVQARYGHLIVPIAGIAPNPAHAPIDVTTMDALVALAERSERLILHHRSGGADTYLVDDAGTLFRHRIAQPAAPAAAS